MLKNQKGKSALQAFAWSSSSMSVPVTRFSVKIYGSLRGIEMERKRQQRAGRFVIHPYSSFRFYWDFVSLVLLIISMLIIPVAITFFNTEMTSDPGWIVFNLSMDCWFLADIIINFHTGYILDAGEGDVVLDLHKVRVQYLKSWFFIDLISTLPLDYILQVTSIDSGSASASRAVKLFRFAKLVSLLRLLRISRLIRYVHQWEQIVGMQYDLAVAAVRIFNLVCLMLLIGHWNGCLQFLIPMLNNFPPDSWIIMDRLLDKPWGEQYSWCLFKAMSHMLCIGYGQQPPKNVMDLWMTMISMVSGAVCFAMFIGHATALIQSMDSSKRQYKEKYTQVKEYMRYRRLPKSIRSRVYKYYEHRFQGKMFDEDGILMELSNNLREEIVNYNCRHLVSSVPFFSNADSDFVTAVVQKLRFEVYLPDDIIVKEGAIGKKMYFIQQGLVEIRKSGVENPIKQLADGSFFGEICLIINDRRVASVVAISYCHTYSLHVDDFNPIVDNYPLMRKTLEQVAAERLKNIGHQNVKLCERLQEATASFREAKTLAAEIARHDAESPCERTPRLTPKRKLRGRGHAGSSGLRLSKSVGMMTSPAVLTKIVQLEEAERTEIDNDQSEDNYFKVAVEDSGDDELRAIARHCSSEKKTSRRRISLASFTRPMMKSRFSRRYGKKENSYEETPFRSTCKSASSSTDVPSYDVDDLQQQNCQKNHSVIDMEQTVSKSNSAKTAETLQQEPKCKSDDNPPSTEEESTLRRKDCALKFVKDLANSNQQPTSSRLPETKGKIAINKQFSLSTAIAKKSKIGKNTNGLKKDDVLPNGVDSICSDALQQTESDVPNK